MFLQYKILFWVLVALNFALKSPRSRIVFWRQNQWCASCHLLGHVCEFWLIFRNAMLTFVESCNVYVLDHIGICFKSTESPLFGPFRAAMTSIHSHAFYRWCLYYFDVWKESLYRWRIAWNEIWYITLHIRQRESRELLRHTRLKTFQSRDMNDGWTRLQIAVCGDSHRPRKSLLGRISDTFCTRDEWLLEQKDRLSMFLVARLLCFPPGSTFDILLNTVCAASPSMSCSAVNVVYKRKWKCWWWQLMRNER